MKSKTVLLILSCLMALSLLLASCVPAAVEKEEEVASPGPSITEDLADKNILMVIAPKDFRDEELFEPKKIFQGKGMKVTIASTSTDIAQGMLGGTVKPDLRISNVNMEDYDVIVIVGGAGSKEYLWENEELRTLAKEAYDKGKVVSAICLSPVVLAKAGVLEGRRATVYPDSEAISVLLENGVVYVDEPVIAWEKVVTGRDPESAREFSLRICEALSRLSSAESEETSTLSGKSLILTYYLDVSGICEKWFKGDISDEELHKIAWEFIVEIAEGKGVDPNSIDYKVKISDLTQLPPGLEHIRWDNVRDGDRQPIKEIPPACPDGHVYAATSNIKMLHPGLTSFSGTTSFSYIGDGSAIVRNEGNSGLMKLRIVPVDNEDMPCCLPEEEECRDNEQTIFVEANKAVYIYIVRSEVKGKLESFPCWLGAVLTTYEHYGETKEMELKDETFYVQGTLTVRLVGRSAGHDVRGVRIWAYPRFWKSRSWETGEDVYYLVGDYRLDGTHVKVW